MADFVLKGCPYPITKTANGYLYSQQGVSQIKSDLLCLLLTNPKERVMHPEFGCNLRQYMFEPADATLTLKVRNTIVAALGTWEPRVVFDAVNVSVDPETNSLSVRIAYRDPQNIQNTEVLTLLLPLGQGGSQ